MTKTNLNEAFRLIQLEEQRRTYRRSYYDFFVYFWNTIASETFRDNWHIKYLCDELQQVGELVLDRQSKAYDLIINISPGESKSTIATILFPAWLWVNDPTLNVISGSYSKDLSLFHSAMTRDCIRSEKFQTLYGHLFQMRRDFDAKTKYMNDTGGLRMAVSTGSAVTGMHAHIIIIDDPVNPKQANSETELKTANQWINQTLSSRKIDKAVTPMILIMQRLHEDDPTGNWLVQADSGRAIRHVCLPATNEAPVYPKQQKANYKDGLMNPWRTGLEVLAEQRLVLGSRAYAGQYLQQPVAFEGNIIKSAWFEWFDRSEVSYPNTVNFYIDSAYTDKSENDPSAIMIYFIYDYHMYILDCRQYWLEFPDLIKKIVELHDEYRQYAMVKVLIEPKASGKSIYQTLKRNTYMLIKEDSPPVSSKKERAYAASPFIENGRVLLLKGADWTDAFIDEVSKFPNAKHDDMTDCLTAAVIRHLSKTPSAGYAATAYDHMGNELT